MKKLLKHLFVPHEKNNHRAKLLHADAIVIAISGVIFLFSLLNPIQNNFPAVLGTHSNISPTELLSITNDYRRENGLGPLRLDSDLSQAAAGKATDMFAKNYWAHIAPDGVTPWSFILNSGYEYLYAGENLARGYSTAQDVVRAWMDSPTHRANMLSKDYSDVGFAIATGTLTGSDTVLVVEMFGTRYEDTENKKETEIAVLNLSPTPGAEILTRGEISPAIIAPVARDNLSVASIKQEPLINRENFVENFIYAMLVMFILVLIIDAVIIERKKIVRAFSHNTDHILYLTLILFSIIIIGRGAIL